MELPSPVPLVELIARRFRLLSEPMRIRLFDRLRDGEATVHELADELGSSQQNVSKHLTLLAEAGVLARRKEGTCVYYRLADQDVLALCEQVCDSVEQHVLDLAALVAPPVNGATCKELSMSKNMTILDRRLRALLMAPLAVLIAVLIGPGSVTSIVLYALAAVMLATAAAGYCPLYSVFRMGGKHGQPQAH